MVKFCPVCGNELNESAAICTKCGTSITSEQPFVPTQPVESMQQPTQPAHQPFEPMQQGYPTQQGYSMQQGYPMQQAPQEVKSSKAPIVLGITGIIMAWLLAIAGHALSITGIALGIKEYKATGKMTGLVLSIIGEVCAIISSVIGAISFSGMF